MSEKQRKTKENKKRLTSKLISEFYVTGLLFKRLLNKAYCDSDFAGDVDDQKSISGYIIYVCGCPIAWRSQLVLLRSCIFVGLPYI